MPSLEENKAFVKKLQHFESAINGNGAKSGKMRKVAIRERVKNDSNDVYFIYLLFSNETVIINYLHPLLFLIE